MCLCCNAKRGAKTDPTKHGKFLTHGSYTTAAILFSAATLYQLGMFLHFKHLGISGSSLFNTGTKSTKRKISEIQGKTNEIQSLDYQPTFADRLDKIKECNLISMLSSIWLMLVKKWGSHLTEGSVLMPFWNTWQGMKDHTSIPQTSRISQKSRSENIFAALGKDSECLRNTCLPQQWIF